jgi:hypothetical protein
MQIIVILDGAQNSIEEIKHLLEGIKHSLESQGWEKFLYVLIGFFPTFLVSYFTNRWASRKEEKMFLLNKAKEEEIFQLNKAKESELFLLNMNKDTEMFIKNKAKEDDRLKARMAGEIKATAYDLKIIAWDAIESAITAEHNSKVIEFYSPEDLAQVKDLNTLRERMEIQIQELRKVKSAFLKILGEYRYYLKSDEFDKKVDVFIDVSKITFSSKLGEMNKAEFEKIDFGEYIKREVEAKTQSMIDAMEQIVNCAFELKI